jgi:hypothetical protein
MHVHKTTMLDAQAECLRAESTNFNTLNFNTTVSKGGYAVAQLVEALRYKPEGRGFDSRRSHWYFSVT